MNACPQVEVPRSVTLSVADMLASLGDINRWDLLERGREEGSAIVPAIEAAVAVAAVANMDSSGGRSAAVAAAAAFAVHKLLPQPG